MATAVEQKTRKPQVRETQCFIGGKWQPAKSGKTFDTINPATEEVIAKVAEGGKEDIDAAVKAARQALDKGPWGKMDARDRGKLINRFADLLQEELEDLAALESLDNGKPIRDSRAADLPLTIDCMRYYAGWADKIHGSGRAHPRQLFLLPAPRTGGRGRADHPLEFPDADGRLEMGPGIGGRLHDRDEARRANAAHLPADGQAGARGRHSRRRDQRHPRLRSRSRRSAGGASRSRQDRLHRLDRNRPPDRPRSRTLDEAHLAGAGRQEPQHRVRRQRSGCRRRRLATSACTSIRANAAAPAAGLYVEDKVHDKFVDKIVSLNKSRKLGDPLDPATEQGPQVDKTQLDKVLGYIEVGKKQGAQCVTGGGRWGQKGYYVEPTLFTEVKDDMTIAQEEIFGPVMSILRFKNLDDIIERANKTCYGLAAAVWTRDIAKAHYVASKIKAGTVWINCYDVFDAAAPFGGFKQSGIGRELGERGLDAYTEWKTVTVSLDQAKS